MNPANFESFTDPEGGSWIVMKKKEVAGIIWRPINLQMTEDDQLSFEVEFLEGDDIPKVTEENQTIFGKMVQAIILESISHAAAEDQALAEKYTQEALDLNDIKRSEIEDEISTKLEGGMQVSSDLLPDELQLDLAMAKSVLQDLEGKPE